MKKILLPFLLTFVVTSVFTQTVEPINTDRPDQSDGAYVLPKRQLQIEEGILFAKETVVNNFMLRYGITKSTEARLLLDAGKIGSDGGLLPVGLSVKQRIIAQHNAIPAITFAGYARYGEIASKPFSSDEFSTNLLLAFQNDITDKFGIGYNVGTTDLFNDVNVTVSLGYAPLDKLSLFLEYFAHFEPASPANHNIDAGILYLINDTFQVDLAAGRSFSNTDAAAFLTTGVSYRFGRR